MIEPTGHETFNGRIISDPSIGTGNTEDYNYATYDAPFQQLPKKIREFPYYQDFDSKMSSRMNWCEEIS